ncbi:Short transmembrane mitochondrial protein 1 [Dillenia turbinata]|uniref:Short transmembrane mitochondrial protein 1 n=1 Tax=Dillenia turbinata TaxID=194707 RepID=A0AAN8Z044_9MAGN
MGVMRTAAVFMLGSTFGAFCGVYIAQNYNIRKLRCPRTEFMNRQSIPNPPCVNLSPTLNQPINLKARSICGQLVENGLERLANLEYQCIDVGIQKMNNHKLLIAATMSS